MTRLCSWGLMKKSVDIFTHVELNHVMYIFVRYPIMCQAGVAILLQWGFTLLLQFNFMPLIWWVLMKSQAFYVFRNNDTGNELGAPMWQASKLEQNTATTLILSWYQFCTFSVPSFLGLNGRKKAKVLTSFLTLTICLFF